MKSGCYTAMVTPFDGVAIDEAGLSSLADFQIQNGISGLLAVGTTGESPTLAWEEHLRVVEIYGWRHHLIAQRQDREQRLRTTGGTEHMAGHRLGRTYRKLAGVVTECCLDRLGFRDVTSRCGSAMGIDVIDLIEIQARIGQRFHHRGDRARRRRRLGAAAARPRHPQPRRYAATGDPLRPRRRPDGAEGRRGRSRPATAGSSRSRPGRRVPRGRWDRSRRRCPRLRSPHRPRAWPRRRWPRRPARARGLQYRPQTPI